MSLICILDIDLRFKGRKRCKLNYFRFWKIKKGLNEEISESRLMDHEEGKTRISWVWKMRNYHYGVRRKARKHGKWGMKKDSTAWKFRTQNLVATYILTLRTNLGHLPESILDIPYIISKIKKSEVQCFKWCANRSWNKEVMTIWRQLLKIEGPFLNSTYEFKIQLEMTPISNSPIATLMFCLLYLGNCI